MVTFPSPLSLAVEADQNSPFKTKDKEQRFYSQDAAPSTTASNSAKEQPSSPAKKTPQ
jgi:hypothetical protein